MPPGGVPVDGGDSADAVQPEAEVTMVQTSGEPPAAPPPLPPSIKTLKVAELKEQLTWRGIKSSANLLTPLYSIRLLMRPSARPAAGLCVLGSSLVWQ